MNTIDTKSILLITKCRSITASKGARCASATATSCTTIGIHAYFNLSHQLDFSTEKATQRPTLCKSSSNQEMSDSCCTFVPRAHSCLAFHVDSFHKATHNAGAAMHSRLSTLLCLGRTPVVSLFTAVSIELTMGIQSETFCGCDRSRAGMSAGLRRLHT